MMLLGAEMRPPARALSAHPRFRDGRARDAVGGAVVEDVIDWLGGFDPFEKTGGLLVSDAGLCTGR
jgi:hypothetical protein